MITVVMSTREKNVQYISDVITSSGVKDVQFLCYENKGEFSLTEIYNKGLAESVNDVVVFIHDDLVFDKSSKWGQKILNHFESSDYGIIGKAGSTYLDSTAIWWKDRTKTVGHVYHTGNHPQTGKPAKWLSEFSGSFPRDIISVAVVDGLFIAVHKKRIKKTFNENIKGFHFYDVEFCISNSLENVPIGVVFDFPITHKSVGELKPEWDENRKQVETMYAGKLPIRVQPDLIYDPKPVTIKKQPVVAIIVPTKGKVDMVTALLQSILHTTTYTNYYVLIADTGSTDEEKQQLRETIREATAEDIPGVRGMDVEMIEYNYYNFSKINNDVVKNYVSKDTELLLFCNNDVVFVNDCISHMVRVYQANKVNCGTVGARLHYEDNTVQHGGIFMTKPPSWDRVYFGHLGHKTDYQYSSHTKPVIGSTAALLLVSKAIFNAVGGFNENYKVCFEDVELNFEIICRNYKNFYCGEATAYHLESQTRGQSVDENDTQRIYQYINNNIQKLAKHML